MPEERKKNTERPKECFYLMRFKKETVRQALSDHIDNRIGSSAIYQTQEAIDRFVEEIAFMAYANLESENKVRQDSGLPPRKTVEAIDIKRALDRINKKPGR